MEVRFNDEDFRSLSEEFPSLAIPTDPARLPGALSLAEQLVEELPETRQPFHMVIMLNSTRQRMTDDDVESMMKSIDDAKLP